MTNQSTSNGVVQHDIIYRNNIIGDCEYSYEFWLFGSSSYMYNICFENNTCLYAGSGWTAYQNRPNGSYGRHVVGLSLREDQMSNINIRNNIFYETTAGFLKINMADADQDWRGLLTVDYNLYYSSTEVYWNWDYTPQVFYYLSQFAAYQSDTGEDAHSILAATDPFVDPSDSPAADFHLRFNSPAIDAGTNTGVATDYDGTARPQGAAYDIGAYEYTPVPMVTGVLVASSAWTSGFLNSLGGVGYAIPDGPNQLLPLPGSNLNEVIIEFNENVNVTESDLALTGVNVPTYGFSAFSYDPIAHRATWTLSQNLVREKLLLDLDGSTANSVVDAAGKRLDGEWVNPTWSPPSPPSGGDAWPSGDGTAGGDFQFRINVLPGDINQDGTVNVSDLAVLAANYRKSLTGWANGDLNCDGVVDVMDLAVLAANYRLGLPVPEPVAPAPALPVAQPAKSLAAATPVVVSSPTTNGSAHIQATASRLGRVNSAHHHIFQLMGDVDEMELPA